MRSSVSALAIWSLTIASVVSAQDSGSIVNRESLVEAIEAVAPGATGWSLRRSDSNWLLEGTDAEIFVDYPAESLDGRVGYHRSSFCSHSIDSQQWVCREPTERGRIEIAPLQEADHDQHSCPRQPARGIDLRTAIPLQELPDLVDWVRSGAVQRQVPAMCQRTWEHWRENFDTCEIASVTHRTHHQVGLRIGSAHILFLEFERRCDDGNCSYDLIGCYDGIA